MPKSAGLVATLRRLLNGKDNFTLRHKRKTLLDYTRVTRASEAAAIHHIAPASQNEVLPFYFGKGAIATVRPVCADRRPASKICTTTIFVSSEERSPSGVTCPCSTAAR